MRLARLVAAGLALGAAIGFLGALLRPRQVHRRPAADAAEPTPDHAAEAEPASGAAAMPSTDRAADVQPARIEHPVSASVR